MEEASRWVRHMIPRGDGTASVSTNYVRNNPFGRRNAEGISLQFCSRDLREQIAGQYYVEIDIRTSHPTMLRARLAAVGKRVRLIDEWVDNKEACAGRIAEETELTRNFRPTMTQIKDLINAGLNGASVEKWVRSKWGITHAPQSLARYAREMQTVRANAHTWFPEIWKCTEGERSDWKRRSSTVFFAMTSHEDEVLEVLRESLPLLGAQCDALTGDGLLARPMHESASPLETVLRVLEVEVLNKIGIPVSLAGKTLRGDPAKDWPTSLSAPRPDSGHILPEAGLQW